MIITDIRMPKMDGITMMNLLREEGCAAHCIVLTAHSDFEYARGALLFGADDYLLKPFRDQELTHAVARVCRRMQPVSAAPAPKEKEPEATGYVRQAMDYIAAHYADADISIAVSAEHLRVSEGTFPTCSKADGHDRHQLPDQDAHRRGHADALPRPCEGLQRPPRRWGMTFTYFRDVQEADGLIAVGGGVMNRKHLAILCKVVRIIG